MKWFHIINSWIKPLTNIGLSSRLTIYEQGLVRITNKVALTVIFMVIILYVPLAFYFQVTYPILFICAILFTITLLLNNIRKYELARHCQLILLYLTIFAISIVRGRESGALYLFIPLILLTYIYFYRQLSMYIHFGLMSMILLAIILYTAYFGPLQPHHSSMLSAVHALHLLISLILTAFFINFFFVMTTNYQQELIELNNTKNKLLSIIGHDLRSPLNSLKGIMHLLNNKHLSPDDFFKLTAHLQKNTELLSNTLDNLLNWSISQMKGFFPVPAWINLQKLVGDQIELMEETARGKNITLINEVPPDTRLYADPNHITLVLRNLLQNAIKFTPEKGTISVNAVSDQKGNVTAYVTDTGDGIDHDHQKHLFKLKETVSKPGTKGETGTGLGLILCKEMVEINGGKMGVSSSPGKGSTFFFTLPVTKNPANPEDKQRTSQLPPSAPVP